MAKLTAKSRSALPDKAFAGPNRTFPVQNPAHARLAIAMASRSKNAGNISAAAASHIVAKARKKLGKTAADG